MLWAKLVIPLAMVTVGAGAAVVAVVGGDDDAPVRVGTAEVWIDAPETDVRVAPGPVHVDAHATADATISRLELLVDGKQVAADDSLERNDKLVRAEFTWTAPKGVHELVVRRADDAAQRSASVTVVVDEGGATPTVPSTTTTPGTTTTATSTTTTTAPDDTTTTTLVLQDPTLTTIPTITLAPPEGDDTVPDTVPPTTPTTRPPPAEARIDSAALLGTNRTVYGGNCAYSVQVQARVRNADSVTMILEDTGFERPMTRSSSTYTATIPSGLWGTGDVGTHRVIVEATGGGSGDRKVAGSIQIRFTCPKD